MNSFSPNYRSSGQALLYPGLEIKPQRGEVTGPGYIARKVRVLSLHPLAILPPTWAVATPETLELYGTMFLRKRSSQVKPVRVPQTPGSW